MGRAAQVYDFSVAAGELAVILAEGSYYRILTSTGAVSVRRDDGSRVGPLLEGQGERNSPFQRLTIQDLSGAANSGTVLVCDGDFVDHRQAGEVLTMPGGSARVLADLAYMDGTVVAALAANYSMCQLWNPAGSGVNVAIDRIWYAANVNLGLNFRTTTTALSTLVNQVKNKRINGPAGLTQIRTEQAAAFVGSQWGGHFYSPNANATTFWDFNYPLIIEPGNGLIAAPAAVNTSLQVMFEFLELPR